MLVSSFSNAYAPMAALTAPDGRVLERFHMPIWAGNVGAVLTKIKRGGWSEPVGRYRATGDPADKRALPAFTPAGVFTVRHPAHLITQSGLVGLDYDLPPTADVAAVRAAAAALPTTVGAFVSPGGQGVKVLVHVSKLLPYADAYAGAVLAYDAHVAYASDPKCKDVARLCFVSHDPDAYINLHAAAMSSAPWPPALSTATGRPDPAAADVEAFTARKFGPYAAGNRAAFLFALACNCNKRGWDADRAEATVRAVYERDPVGIPPAEPTRVVQNAYRRGAHEHGRYARRDGRP